MEFELMTSVSEQAKTFRALDSAATESVFLSSRIKELVPEMTQNPLPSISLSFLVYLAQQLRV
jgi:hypothetical protein